MQPAEHNCPRNIDSTRIHLALVRHALIPCTGNLPYFIAPLFDFPSYCVVRPGEHALSIVPLQRTYSAQRVTLVRNLCLEQYFAR